MPITGLRILPPFAIGRFGSSTTPLEAYKLEVPKENPLDFRRIVGCETFEIDPETGAIIRQYTPEGESIRFKDGDQVRPVAPFLEVFAQTDENTLEPLTLTLLSAEGLTADSVEWSVHVANLKVFRQTSSMDDKVTAVLEKINDHALHELKGTAINFSEGKYIPFGSVRYIRPTEEFPQIRLRYTPGAGLVYGARKQRVSLDNNKLEDDPVFKNKDGQFMEERIVYDPNKGKWLGFQADILGITNP